MKIFFYQGILVCALSLIIVNSYAGNPVIADVGMSDPHARVFNDTVYLYTGHDGSPNDNTWVMRDWKVYSTTDLVNWTLEATISPANNYMPDNSTDCWAGDAATRNGNYYFYFSDRNRSTGVMFANSPGGIYADAIGSPLVEPGHDPTVFIDDDINNTPYLVYGSNEIGGFHIAKLNENMISLAETPELITITGQEWVNAPDWQDKNYLFKHNDTYYLSWGQDYATSTNVYGPYQSIGAVGSGYKLSEFSHGSFFWWKGQFYHVWCYYIVDGKKWRESIITYCHFDNNGHIVTDTRFLDQHFSTGVGQYETAWDTIQAEWYYEISEGINKIETGNNNFVLTNIGNNAWIRFANVSFNKDSVLKAQYNFSGTSGFVEAHLDSVNGTLIGTIDVSTGNNLLDSCMFDTLSGTMDLFLVFNTDADSTFEIDWFEFVGNEPIEYLSIPGRIEAEDYDAMSGIQTEGTSDIGGGLNVGYISNGDWLEYRVYADSTTNYLVEYRVAALENNIMFDLVFDDSIVSNINWPYTGGWQSWTTVYDTISLTKGEHTMRVQMTGDRWNFNWMNFSVYAPNEPPVVTIIQPAEGAVLTEPASINVNATATDSDGDILGVQLFLNNSPVGTDNASPYEWTSTTHSALQSLTEGNYQIVVVATDNRGAEARDTLSVLVENATLIDSYQSDVKIFPNPINDELTIVLPYNHSFNNLQLIDMCGKELINKNIKHEPVIILNNPRIQEFSPGVYIVRLYGDNKNQFIKVSKE